MGGVSPSYECLRGPHQQVVPNQAVGGASLRGAESWSD